MKKVVVVFVLSAIFLPQVIALSYSCEDGKQKISHLLTEGISRMRIRAEQVASSNLTLEEKQKFKTEVEWVSAWTRDIIGRLTPEMAEKEEGIQCEEITELTPNIRAQWKPLILMSRRLFIQSIIKNAEPEDYEEISEIFEGAENVKHLTESRTAIRRAIFRLRNAMRESKKAVIIP